MDLLRYIGELLLKILFDYLLKVNLSKRNEGINHGAFFVKFITGKS